MVYVCMMYGVSVYGVRCTGHNVGCMAYGVKGEVLMYAVCCMMYNV